MLSLVASALRTVMNADGYLLFGVNVLFLCSLLFFSAILSAFSALAVYPCAWPGAAAAAFLLLRLRVGSTGVWL